MKHYELSLHAYEYMYTRFLSHLEGSLKKIENDPSKYAPDLETIGQKRLRAVNNAIQCSVKETQRRFELGIISSDDVCRDEWRALHYGVKIGDVIQKLYRCDKDFREWRVFLIKELRHMSRIDKHLYF